MARVLVLGSSGQTGRRLVDVISGLPDVFVRGVSRRSSSSEPRFDWADESTWRPAVEGMDSLYLVKPPPNGAIADVAGTIAAFLEAAPLIRRVVLLSEIGAGTRAEHLDERRVERVIENGAFDWTILRPHWFMQNFSDPNYYLSQLRDECDLRVPTGGQAVSFVDTRDIAEVAAAALLENGHSGKYYTLTGPRAHTWRDAVGMISKAAGRDMRYVDIPLDAHLAQSSKELPSHVMEHDRAVYEFLRSEASAEVSGDVETILKRPARSFESYVLDSSHLWRELQSIRG